MLLVLSFFSVDLVICWRAIGFALVLHQPVAVEVAALLLRGWIQLCSNCPLSEGMAAECWDLCVKKWECWDCLCCLFLWSPRALALKGGSVMTDCFALALFVFVLPVSSFEWMCCIESGLLELQLVGWFFFFPWWLLFWLVCGLLCRCFW